MIRTIKLMADYDSFPLWKVDPGIENIDPATLPLSADTQYRLRTWADTYDRTLNRADPAISGFHTPKEEAAFEIEGRALWLRLQQELAGQYRVLYFSETEQRLLDPNP